VIDWMLTPENKKLMEIEEPYEYRDRLKLPKYIVNATGDQFFVPDSAQFYWRDLEGEKYLRYEPNADHSLRNTDALPSMVAFFQTVIQDKPRPQFDWRLENDGSIRVTAKDTPSEAKLWQASNEKARDFRLMTIGPAWTSAPLEGSNRVYVGNVETPAAGWTAFFVELTYPGPGKFPLKFTTQVRVIPDKYPFPAPDLKKPE
jgi:PhoPQ-activated pathogenicity-related protein